MIIYIDENLPPQLGEGLNKLQQPLNKRNRTDFHVRSIKIDFGEGVKDETWIPRSHLPTDFQSVVQNLRSWKIDQKRWIGPHLNDMNKKKKESAKIKEKERIQKYTRFLKKNPDWDYSAILDLLRFKLKRVRKCIKSNNLIVPEQITQISSQIKEVEKLLQRVFDDQYYFELMEEYQKKYGKVKYIFIKIKGSKSKSLETRYDVPDELLEEAKEAHHQIGLQSVEMQKADLKKAFDLMAENIWNWWD